MSIRMLWISIRAIQYTDRAFKAINQNITDLQRAEKGLGQTGDVMKTSAGIMWLALGTLALSGITTMMRACQEGNRVMNIFDKSVNDLTKSFGEAFTKVLGPVITSLSNFFEFLSKLNPAILQMLSIVTLIGIGLVMFAGAVWMVQGVLGILGGVLQSSGFAMLLLAKMEGVAGLENISFAETFNFLHVSIAGVVGIFGIFIMLGMMFGGTVGEIVAGIGAITVALIALTHWQSIAAILQGTLDWWSAAAMIAGGLAVGGAIAAMMPSAQTGTRKAQVTGPVLVHAGERIGKEDQLKRELGGNNGPARSQTAVTINFSGNIQTKADKEQLKPLILKSIKEALDNKA